MKSKFNKLYIPAVILLLIVFLATGCTEGFSEDHEIFIPVEIFEPVPETIQTEIVYSGRVSANESVFVISRLAGRVVETYFNIGDTVQIDDVLFRLDEQDIENQVRALESQIGIAGQGRRAAENALRQATGGQFQSSLLQLESAVISAEAQLEAAEIALRNAEIAQSNAANAYSNASSSFESARVLHAAGAMSRNDFERAEIGYNQAASAVEQASLGMIQAGIALDTARSGLAMARDTHSITATQISQENRERAQIGISQAVYSEAAAAVQLQIALDTLEDTAVRSPINGVVSARNARVGEFISSQNPAFHIVNMDTVIVDVRVSEIIINRIAQGDAVDVHIRSISSEPIVGTVKTVSPAADHTNLFPVQVEIDNQDGLIRPGMFAEVRFVRELAVNAIVLPRSAVMRDETSHFVFVIEDGIARRVRVETGIDNGAFIEVISGIYMSSQVVVAGQDFLSDGVRVEVVGVY